MQHRGARTREPDDHERPLDALLFDLGVAVVVVLRAQPVHEQADVALELHRAADRVESRLVAQRAQQARERLAERGIAEVGESGAALRLGEHRLELERRLGLLHFTWSTSLPSTSRRASRSSASGNCANGTGASSGTRNAPRARCASSSACAAPFVSRP